LLFYRAADHFQVVFVATAFSAYAETDFLFAATNAANTPLLSGNLSFTFVGAWIRANALSVPAFSLQQH
jgi:hypothetical protein